MTPRILALLLPLVPLATLATPAVQEHRLANGMTVLIKPDHRAPILTSQVWYRVGSSYEHVGITGISHLLEHMMFQGTEQLGPGELSRIVAENGGEENAFTGRDYTAYYQNLAKDRLEVSFRLESDRMRHLALQEKELAKELEVVKEERRTRTDDDPQSLTFERFNAAAFDVSSYRNPVIGWPSDLDQLGLADLRDWYRRWYSPSNAILVVAGDVDPSAVLALAERYFGPLPAAELTPSKVPREPEQRGEKRLRVAAPAKEPYLIMGYKVPTAGSAEVAWEPYALEMLSYVLDASDSARFSRELVRGEQVAASAGASYSGFQRLAGLFVLDGVPASGHSIAELEQALRAQVERVRARPVDLDELARVRSQVVASKVYAEDSLSHQATMLGQLAAMGLDWRLADTYVDALAAVTPEQIQAVASKYLTPERLTVAVLDPQPVVPTLAKASHGSPGDPDHAR